ncbi:MAG TPA: Ig-like domain-containing protein [Thermoanaerobaculia bacterium]|nr:Ig-like domain-containing protein [Thermoanaerobaculia bacterium]
MRNAVAALVLIALAACRTETTSHCVIAWNRDAGTIEVTGFGPRALERLREERLSEEEWIATFAVHSGPPDAPAMLGAYEVTENAVVFRPRFPLVPGVPYRVRFDTLETTIIIPKPATAPTTHVQVFPTADELPANQLKFYLDFSSPMSVGDVYRHIHLLDDTGHEVQRAFLQTAHELWDARRRRFTLILDPGRIKRGLRANVESGAPLREGGRYRLVIDAAWQDGDGNPLRAPFEKTFRVVAADRTMPEPKAWRVSAPSAGTSEPLRVSFDEPLDRALLEEMLIVRDERRTDIEGDIEIASAETEWIFRPRQAWREGTYAVHVDTRIEDRAGNNLQRLFDEEVAPAARSTSVSPIELPFTSRRSAGR